MRNYEKKPRIPPHRVKFPRCKFCHGKVVYASKKRIGYREYAIGVCIKCYSIRGKLGPESRWASNEYNNLTPFWRESFKAVVDDYYNNKFTTKW